MVIGADIVLQIAKQTADWTSAALASARNRRQQRFAHVIGNSGFVLRGLRVLDQQIREDLVPLRHFSAAEWDTADLRALQGRLMHHANSSLIPQVRAAESALRVLSTKQTDTEITMLLRQFVATTAGLCTSTLDPYEKLTGYSPSEAVGEQMWAGPLDANASLDKILPNLLDLLRSPDNNEVPIRQTAAEFLDGQAAELRSQLEVLDGLFGKLLAKQQLEFPALAAPTWAMEQ